MPELLYHGISVVMIGIACALVAWAVLAVGTMLWLAWRIKG